MATANNIYTLSVDSSTKHLAEVRDFVAEHAQNLGLSDKDISNVNNRNHYLVLKQIGS